MDWTLVKATSSARCLTKALDSGRVESGSSKQAFYSVAAGGTSLSTFLIRNVGIGYHYLMLSRDANRERSIILGLRSG